MTQDINQPSPGWKNMRNVFFECREWTLANGIVLRHTREKEWRNSVSFSHKQPDRWEVVDGELDYGIPEAVFCIILGLAGRRYEEPDE